MLNKTALFTIIILPQKIYKQLGGDDLKSILKKQYAIDEKYFFIFNKEDTTSFFTKLKKYFNCLIYYRLCKTMAEKSQEFYKEKYRKQKTKINFYEERKQIPPMAFKLIFKMGFFEEVLGNSQNAIELYKQAYNKLNSDIPNMQKIAKVWEIKAVADLLIIKISYHYLAEDNTKEVLNIFCKHFALYKQVISQCNTASLYLVLLYILLI